MNFPPHRMALAIGACIGMAAAAQAAAGTPEQAAYVTSEGAGVTVLDIQTLKPVAEIAVGRKPRGIGISPDGRWLLTANQGSSDVSVVDTRTRKEIKRINVGKNVEFMRITADGKRALVTYEPAGLGGPPGKEGHEKEGKDSDDLPAEVAIIDLKKWAVVGRVKASPETEGIELTPDGKSMVVTNEGDNTIAVYNLATLKKTSSIDISSHGSRPRGIKVSPDGKSYVVTLENSGNYLVLDAQFKPIKTVATENGPYGVAFDPEGRYIWIAAARAGQLQVFNADSHTLKASIPVGKRCWHFSFTPDAKKLLLACGRSNALQVIDTQKYEVADTLEGYKMPWGVITYPKSEGSLDAPSHSRK